MTTEAKKKPSETLKIPVYNRDGVKTGEYALDSALLGGVVRRKLLKEAVLMYEANQRVGTHFALTRSEAAGSGKKVYAQKHTGRARMGHRQTNKRVGGGVMFAPKPRDYSYSINKRGRREALKSALLAKIQDHELCCVDSFGLDKPKTQVIAKFLKKVGISRSALLGTKVFDELVFKSARNISNMQVRPVAEFNAYEVIRQHNVVLMRDALDALKEKFSHEIN